MHYKRYIFFFLLLVSPLILISCQEKEQQVEPVAKKPEEALPLITEDRISLWVEVAGDIGAYIRKVSLKEEDVYEKRTLVMIAHSSARTELEYSNIFKNRGMTSKEFWNIVDEMERIQKYQDIKKEEYEQAIELDRLINSGVDEIKLLRQKLEKEKSDEKKKSILETIGVMEKKIDEFRDFKANITPQSVNINPSLIKLWDENKEKYETALAAMWKKNSAAPVRKSYQHM